MSTAEVRTFVRRWWWLLALGVLLAGIPTYFVSALSPRVFEARARLIVGSGAIATAADPGQVGDQVMATSIALIGTGPTVNLAAAQVPGVSPLDVAAGLEVVRVADTPFISVVVHRPDPSSAVGIANAVATNAAQQANADQAQTIATRTNQLDALVAQRAAALDGRTLEVSDLRAGFLDANAGQQLVRAQAQLSLAQQDYENAVAGRDEQRLAGINTPAVMSVVEPAAEAYDISASRRSASSVIAAVLGLLVALGVAFLVDRLADRFPSSAELWRTMGVPVLGSVQQMSAAGALSLLIRPESLPPHEGESLRFLRSAVLGALPEVGVRTLLVTSRRGGEGKTTIAAGLASTLALAGRRVVLIRADLPSPAINRVPDAWTGPGLTALLKNDRLAVAAALRPTTNPRLWLLPSGSSIIEAAANLSASRRLRQRLAELRGLADMVIVDWAGVDQHDTPTLAAFVDLVLLVVDPRLTSAGATLETVNLLREAGNSPVALVINRVSPASAAARVPSGVAALRARLEVSGT